MQLIASLSTACSVGDGGRQTSTVHESSEGMACKNAKSKLEEREELCVRVDVVFYMCSKICLLIRM